jgi:hypothetical protein
MLLIGVFEISKGNVEPETQLARSLSAPPRTNNMLLFSDIETTGVKTVKTPSMTFACFVIEDARALRSLYDLCDGAFMGTAVPVYIWGKLRESA